MTLNAVTITPERLAQHLEEVWQANRPPIAPFSETGLLSDVNEAYAVQTLWTHLRKCKGDKILGRKIGLTSRAMQEQLGVNEPDYGSLWASRYFPIHDGIAKIEAERFIQPRLECEVAFLLENNLKGPGVAAEDVIAATRYVTTAVEIIDSRIENWRIKLVDTVADNASYGGFSVGVWGRELLQRGLPNVRIALHQNGALVAEGAGSAVMEDPAIAAAWLINKLASFGVAMQAGDIILSGSVAKAVPIERGDVFEVITDKKTALRVTFT